MVGAAEQRRGPEEQTHTGQPYDLRPGRTTVLGDGCKSLDYSARGDRIATAMMGVDGFYDVTVCNADGTDPVVLTRDKPECPSKHNGNPAWMSSGRYIIFTAENDKMPQGKEINRAAD